MCMSLSINQNKKARKTMDIFVTKIIDLNELESLTRYQPVGAPVEGMVV